jgi:hypothetical protein
MEMVAEYGLCYVWRQHRECQNQIPLPANFDSEEGISRQLISRRKLQEQK